MTFSTPAGLTRQAARAMTNISTSLHMCATIMALSALYCLHREWTHGSRRWGVAVAIAASATVIEITALLVWGYAQG